MRNKILLVSNNPAEIDFFELLFVEMIASGGELFITQKKEEGMRVAETERPSLIFINGSLVDTFEAPEGHQVWIRPQGQAKEGEDTLTTPYTTEEVLQKVLPFLDTAFSETMRPM